MHKPVPCVNRAGSIPDCLCLPLLTFPKELACSAPSCMLKLTGSTRFAVGRAPSLLSFMSQPLSFTPDRDPLPDHEQKQAALSYLNEAWAEARHDGVDEIGR